MFNIITLIVSDFLIVYDINFSCNALMMNIYYIQSHAALLGRGKKETSHKNLVISTLSEKLCSIPSSKSVKGGI